MILLKKYRVNLFHLYVTLSALQMCYEINRVQVLFLEYCNWALQSMTYVQGRYTEFAILNSPYMALNKGSGSPSTKSLQSHKIWKTLLDDLVDFEHNNNKQNITIYPLDIKKESNNTSNYIAATGTSSSLTSGADSELHTVIRSIDWSQNLGGLIDYGEIEDNSCNEMNMKEKPLDNGFYDLHLNTVTDVRLLKKDLFLPNLYNSCERVSFRRGYPPEVNPEMIEQEYDMADVLYKQDVDLGYTLSPIKSSCKLSTNRSNKNEEAEKVEAIQSIKDSKLAEILYQQDIDLGYILSPVTSNDATILNDLPNLDEVSNTITDCKALKADKITEKEHEDIVSDAWAGIPFKIDNETGEYIRLPLDDLFQDILPFSENGSNSLNSSKLEKTIDEDKNSSESLNDTIDDISLIMQSFWPSSQHQKPDANVSHDNACGQGSCSIPEPETRSADHCCPVRMDSRIQDIANLFAPVPGFYGANPDITSNTHYHAHYPPKNNPNILPYTSRQHPLHNSHRENNGFPTHFAHNLESAGTLSLNRSNPNGEIHYIKSFSSTSADLVQTEGFLSSFLNEDCIQMMDISGNERSPTCNQDAILPMGNSAQTVYKSLDSNNSLCANNITERLDLSCDSAVSSLGSERVPSTSDGEWGEGSDSGQDYHQGNCYGPYDCSSNSRNFTTRQMPAAQKKYHMFGKRYFQEQTPENAIIHSTIHFLHSTNSVGECDGIDSIIENSAFDDCREEMLPIANVKNSSKLTHSNVKSERDKFVNNVTRPRVIHENVIGHNHTYTLLHNSASNSRFARDNSECKEILPDGHLTRDEKRARNLNVPIPVPEIINLPMDEFNERISKYDLTENQLSLIRDIRRRGKNKVAAQNCRKRKLDQILSLEGEVKEVRRRKDKLNSDKAYIATEKKRIVNKFANLHQHIFQFLRDAEGNPCSPSKYSLQQASDGSIYLLPRDSSKIDPAYSILIGTSETSSGGFSRQRRGQQSYARMNSNGSHSTTSAQPQINSERKDD